MKQSEIIPLLKAYGERYGEHSMRKYTIGNWSAKLKDQDVAEIRPIFLKLLENEPYKWGLGKVFAILNDRPDNAHADLEKEWKDNPKPLALKEKQREVGAFVRDMIDEIKERRRQKQEPIEWVSAYAHKYLEVMGRDEARKVCEKLQYESGKTDTEIHFVSSVMKGLR